MSVTLDFPSGLPAPSVDLSASFDTGVSRLDLGKGKPYQLQRYSTFPQEYRLTWRLTRAQFNQAVSFFQLNGERLFNIPLPSLSGTGALTSVEAELVSETLTWEYATTGTWVLSGQFQVLTGLVPDPDLIAGSILLESGDSILLEVDDGSVLTLESANAILTS